jgi:hypothetical protein
MGSGAEGGGVGVARRGANRCPQASQKIRWLGLPFPHLLQITGFVMGQRRTVDRQVVFYIEGVPTTGQAAAAAAPEAPLRGAPKADLEGVLRLESELQPYQMGDPCVVREGARVFVRVEVNRPVGQR